MFKIQSVMDREKVANAIHELLDTGINLLRKSALDKDDFARIKVMRTMSSNVNAAVLMVQQETAQQRNTLIAQRMQQLGYTVEPKQVTD